MREHLLGYLLGALDPAEHAMVEDRLGSDPRLRHDLEILRRGLEPLAADQGHLNPPDRLARRTCEFVALRAAAITMTSIPAGSRPAWRLQDLLVTAGIFVAAALIFFPAVSQSRHNAHLAGCQNNLRLIGTALQKYSDHQQGYFPYVSPQGRFAAAGIYGPTLLAGGYLDNPSALVCPACPLADDPQFRVPSLDELAAASGQRLAALRRTMGGSYGYGLGYIDGGRYRGIRNQGRTHYALLSDAPSQQLPRRQSANHGGCGQNVLFESGRVAFLARCQEENTVDDFFVNHHGLVAPGLGPDDAVLASSGVSPNVRLRSHLQANGRPVTP